VSVSTKDRRGEGGDLELISVLQALSDPVRLEIVRQLAGCSADSALSCGQIELEVSKSTASHHLKTLRSAGITAEREEGTRKFTWLRKSEMEERFPGLLESVLSAAAREDSGQSG
jgi:DNA-binding transcriptional ArsR family regulator